MNYWRPVPQALIAELLMHRWSKDNPAPEVVGYMVALDRAMSGSPFSARKLATYCGWSHWHANQTKQTAMAFLAEWEDETGQPLVRSSFTRTQQTPTLNDYSDIQTETKQKPNRKHKESNITRAVIQDTTEQVQPSLNTNVGVRGSDALVGSTPNGGGPPSLASEPPVEKEATPPRVKSDKVDLTGLWEQMEDLRLAASPGTRRAALGRRREQLRARVAEHGVDAVLHCWRWWWEADDQRARFLREGGYGIGTFLRAGKLRDYMDRATAWDPTAQADMTAWYTDEDFDEQGNLRQQ